MYDVKISDLFISRDVIFVENQFPYIHKAIGEQRVPINNEVEDCLTDEELDRRYRMNEQEKTDE